MIWSSADRPARCEECSDAAPARNTPLWGWICSRCYGYLSMGKPIPPRSTAPYIPIRRDPPEAVAVQVKPAPPPPAPPPPPPKPATTTPPKAHPQAAPAGGKAPSKAATTPTVKPPPKGKPAAAPPPAKPPKPPPVARIAPPPPPPAPPPPPEPAPVAPELKPAPIPKPPRPRVDADRLAALLGEGVTQREAARALGVTSAAIHRSTAALRAAGKIPPLPTPARVEVTASVLRLPGEPGVDAVFRFVVAHPGVGTGDIPIPRAASHVSYLRQTGRVLPYDRARPGAWPVDGWVRAAAPKPPGPKRGVPHPHVAPTWKRGDPLPELDSAAPRGCCIAAGCDQPPLARRVCSKHLSRFRAAGRLDLIPRVTRSADQPAAVLRADPDTAPDRCRIKGCDRKIARRGLCWTHRRDAEFLRCVEAWSIPRLPASGRRTIPTAPVDTSRPEGVCISVDCDNAPVVRRLCWNCYKRRQQRGQLVELPPRQQGKRRGGS